MKATFWGVRGSNPAPGREFNRYGGNTPCVAVTSQDGHLLVLDAGTGSIGLGQSLMSGPAGAGKANLALLLTHAHWDHLQGVPFFPPLYVPGNHIQVLGASGSSNLLERTLEGQLNPHFSPIQSLSNFGATVDLTELTDGSKVDLFGVTVSARANPHGNVTALALKLEENGKVIVYAPDAGYPNGRASDETIAFYRGADLLIHDCTFSPEDGAARKSRGYSSTDVAAQTAARAGVKTLVMFHYDQDYTDDEVDALRDNCRQLLNAAPGGENIKLIAAYEGLTATI